MDCPVCKNAMITCELYEVEIDYCLQCSGIWLDAGELEMLLGDSSLAEQVLNSFRLQRHPTEKCLDRRSICRVCERIYADVCIREDRLFCILSSDRSSSFFS